MSKMIHVTPAEGMRIMNPFTRRELKPGILPDDPFWHAREREGGVVITDPAAQTPQATPVPVAAKPAVKAKTDLSK